MSLLSVAESCTCGQLQSAFGGISGISAVFAGGVTTYTLKSKVNILSVDEQIAKECDCISSDVAIQMVDGVTKMFDTPFGISITGHVNPSDENKNPFMFVGIKTPNGTTYAKSSINPQTVNGREEIQYTFARVAIRYFLNTAVIEGFCDPDGNSLIDKSNESIFF